MGTQVSATLNDELKPNYSVATVLAANFLVPDEDCTIFIGDDFPSSRKLEVVNSLINCAQRIQENGNVTPLTTNETYAKTGTANKLDIVYAGDAAAVLPLESEIGVWYGPDFQQHQGSSLMPFVKRLIEVYLERVQKAA
jgi:hypothetical protein